MLLTTLCTAALALTASLPLVLASSPQLAFLAPSDPSRHPGHLVQLSYADRASLASAVAAFEQHDTDVWFAGRRSTPDQPWDEMWEAVVRLPDGDLPEEGPLAKADAVLEDAGVRLAELGGWQHSPSLEEHLSSPSLSTSYSLALSAATLANASSTSYDSTAYPIHDSYHPYDGIREILAGLQSRFPEWVEVFSLGQSSEGREIWAARVTNLSSVPAEASPSSFDEAAEENEDDDDGERVGPPPLFSPLKRHKHKRLRPLSFVIAGTQHAREWVAASTTLYMLHDLLAAEDAKAQKARARLLNDVEFTFVPVVNPDGYVYSWEHDRLWRKSRQPVGKGCFGIDLNRNWGFHFQPGARPNPCSDSYPGQEAFQSPELQALSALLSSKDRPVDAFLDVHSFGQMLLYPYSYSCDARTPDEENQSEALLTMSKALKGVHGRSFETGSVCEVSLTSPGESLDWSYATAKIRWSFATELRDGGVFGFLLPPSQIRPSGEEMSAALRALTQFILDKEAGKR
ncbi:hypothetical protein JCM10213_007442 [Rhodosporidiobolus nylandii]